MKLRRHSEYRSVRSFARFLVALDRARRAPDAQTRRGKRRRVP